MGGNIANLAGNYMRLYFALSYSPFSEMAWVKETGIKRVLLSYHVIGNKKVTEGHINKHKNNYEFFLDSGAFSAFTKKVKIDIDKYADFIKKTKEFWKVYATLDVIGDWKATKDNTGYLEKQGLSPLPVFHYKSPIKELERLATSYPYIALGGLVPLAKQADTLRKWLDYCYRYLLPQIKKRQLKVHGFGVNSLWAWKRYPFYSVDSTSWNQGSKYGRVKMMKDFTWTTADKNNIYDVQRFFRDKNWKVRTEQNIKIYLKAEKLVTELWEKRGIKWNE